MGADANDKTKIVNFMDVLTTAPTPDEYQTKTGLVHCFMKRKPISSPIGLASNKFYFVFQSLTGAEKTYLIAEQESAHGYAIFNATNHVKIGTLGRMQLGMRCITYALYNQEGIQVATILYEVPSIVRVLRNAHVRRAQVALMPPTSFDDTTDPLWFEVACKESIRKHGNLNDLAQQALLFESMVPYDKKKGRVGLNFNGRGRESSNKNMQLSHGSDKDKVLVQMAKWENATYNVDFACPFTFVHAFAFGLAQWDL